MTSDELAEACAQRAPSGTAPDAYFQNPEVSVPDLVGVVADKHGLGRDSAALYLQLLALPDPTDKRVAVWTGWKAPRLEKARAALAETDLVLTPSSPRGPHAVPARRLVRPTRRGGRSTRMAWFS